MKNDTKIEEELTCNFKIDIRNVTNSDLSLNNLCFNWFLLTEIYIV